MAAIRRRLALLSAALCALALSACATTMSDPAPKGMVAAADPRAVDAGLAVLARGGNAVDAAMAVQAVLGLVEPQSSGLGGGAFALVWMAEEGRLYAYDGRETAPASATPEQFLDADGKPLSYRDAVFGGKSVGVPGLVAMMDLLHRDHGALDWSTLYDDAIALGDNGFAISDRLAMMITLFPPTKEMPATNAYFFDENDEPYPAGHVIVNTAYADTLRTIASEGAAGFYTGPIAEAIADAVTNAPRNAMPMTLEDIAGYEAKRRDPICVEYRVWSVCGMSPPTSGGIAVGQILGMLEPFDVGALDPSGPEFIHLMGEAARLAYADRAMYVGDSDFVDVPVAGLLNKEYLAARSALIDPAAPLDEAKAGDPWAYMAEADQARAPDVSPEYAGTSHFSIVDGDGNVVSMTTTIESLFGSHLMAAGFFLNNELTDFSFEPRRDGALVANAVMAGKRPRSSMSPTIVFDADGAPYFAIGSPGGSRIPLYVTKALIGVLDQGLSVQDAVALPNHADRNRGSLELERDTALDAVVPALEAKGHEIRRSRMTSGLNGIRITPEGLEGGADPRREGTADGL